MKNIAANFLRWLIKIFAFWMMLTVMPSFAHATTYNQAFTAQQGEKTLRCAGVSSIDWVDRWTGCGGSVSIQGDTNSYLASLETNNQFWSIWTPIEDFDLSTIAATKVITYASFRAGAHHEYIENSGFVGHDYGVYASTLEHFGAINVSDWGHFDSTLLSSEYSYSNWTTDGYEEFILNSTGIALLQDAIENHSGHVRLGVLSSVNFSTPAYGSTRSEGIYYSVDGTHSPPIAAPNLYVEWGDPPPANTVSWISPADGSTSTSTPILMRALTTTAEEYFYLGFTAVASSTGITEVNFGNTLYGSYTVGPDVDLYGNNGECYSVVLDMWNSSQNAILATSTARTLCVAGNATSYGLPVPSPVGIPYASYVPESLQQMGIATPTVVWTAMTGAFESFLTPIRMFFSKMGVMNTASATESAVSITTSTVGILAYAKFGLQLLPQLPFSSMLGWLAAFFVIFGIFQLVRLIMLKR